MALMDIVFELEGKSDDERKETILHILEEKSYEYDIEKFGIKGETGNNIILEIGDGKKEILLVSHYDAFQNSPGANDNASAIAVSLDIYRRLHEYKKKGLLQGKIKIIFFGMEEPNFAHPSGRLGSKAYIAKHEHELGDITAVLNLELCGAGDTIAIWPVTSENEKSKVLGVARKVFEKIKVPYETIGRLPNFSADYKSFSDADLADAFCFTAFKGEDKENLRLYASSIPGEIAVRNVLGVVFKQLKVKTPELFMYYHNSSDKSSALSEPSLRMMSDAMFNLVVNIDKKFGKEASTIPEEN